MRFNFGTILMIAGSLAGTANASTIAYNNDVTNLFLQNWGRSLGMDFQVNTPIAITALGAFDNGVLTNLNGSDGTSGVTVLIYDLSNQQQVGSSVTFSAANPGTQINGDAFLPVNFVLAPGSYSVVAWNDINYNSSGAPNTTSHLNTGGGDITFIDGSRYALTAGVFPNIVDGGPVNRYDAGTFAFTPEPATFCMIGCAFLGFGLLRRRRG